MDDIKFVETRILLSSFKLEFVNSDIIIYSVSVLIDLNV